MGKSKIDFISDLLANNKLDSSMKQKFFELAANEIKSIQYHDSKIWDEINKLKAEFEREIKNTRESFNNINTESSTKISTKPLIKDKTHAVHSFIHDPRKTAESLKLFRTGSRLKWITHVKPNADGDSFDYTNVTLNAINEFKEIAKKLPPNVAAFISVFLQRPKKGTNKFFYLGDYYDTWWSEKIVNWCKDHPGIHPDTDEFISSKIITPFKKSVEIRDGNDLKNAIEYILKKTYGENAISEINIDYSGVTRGTRFYTGVDQLMTGIAAIFAPILKRKSQSKNIKISSTNSAEFNGQFVTTVEISHINSPCDKEYHSQALLYGDMLTAKEKFQSLCEWYISASFINGSYSVCMLDSTNSLGDTKIENEKNNFTHKLIFY